MPAQDIWRLEIVNREEVGNVWHALESEVRFIHVNTNVAVAFSGRSLPEWGHHQFEIVGDNMINHKETIFNVEEHRYTRSTCYFNSIILSSLTFFFNLKN
jgi:dolichyl-phosphate-mannose-protein mannosyltransferase